MTSRAAGTGATGTMRAEISKAVQKLYARWGFWSTSQRPALSESRYPIFLIGLPSWAATPFMRSPGRQRRAPRLIHGGARAGCHGGCANVADDAGPSARAALLSPDYSVEP